VIALGISVVKDFLITAADGKNDQKPDVAFVRNNLIPENFSKPLNDTSTSMRKTFTSRENCGQRQLTRNSCQFATAAS
jgi:hypothetical protein